MFLEPKMTDGQAFLEYISGSSTNKFEICFSKISKRLRLGEALDARELSRLYEAAFLASLCNISINGLGECGGEIKPNRELVRIMLEREFMDAKARFFSCAGIQQLSTAQKDSISRIFLNVLVTEENLA
jgi:hypothetical protein